MIQSFPQMLWPYRRPKIISAQWLEAKSWSSTNCVEPEKSLDLFYQHLTSELFDICAGDLNDNSMVTCGQLAWISPLLGLHFVTINSFQQTMTRLGGGGVESVAEFQQSA